MLQGVQTVDVLVVLHDVARNSHAQALTGTGGPARIQRRRGGIQSRPWERKGGAQGISYLG